MGEVSLQNLGSEEVKSQQGIVVGLVHTESITDEEKKVSSQESDDEGDEDERLEMQTSTVSQHLRSIINIKSKYEREGYFIMGILLALFIFFTTQLLIQAVKDRRDTVTSISSQSVVGNARFPYMTACGWDFTRVGMQPSWFENMTVEQYTDWDTKTTGGSQYMKPVQWRFTSGAPYGRNGSCIEIDSGTEYVQSFNHYLRVYFVVNIDWEVFCIKYNGTECMEYHFSGWVPAASHLFNIFVYPTADRTGKASEVIPIAFNDITALVNVDQTRTVKLNGEEDHSWTFSAVTSPLKKFKNSPDGYMCEWWFKYNEESMTVLKEVESGKLIEKDAYTYNQHVDRAIIPLQFRNYTNKFMGKVLLQGSNDKAVGTNIAPKETSGSEKKDSK
eukprot:jgi/Bigna1/146427/aug1.114_g21135